MLLYLPHTHRYRYPSSSDNRSQNTQHSNSLRESRRQISDAQVEREISDAARGLGESIQKVVLDAKLGKQAKRRPSMTHVPNNWRDNLLKILGGADEDVVDGTCNENVSDNGNFTGQTEGSSHSTSDVDKLLKNSHCDKFILRCMENELPPNLIHCMRLLRVLELKNSSSASASKDDDQNDVTKNDEKARQVKAVSKRATEKVNKLLCLLCGDPSVGEQLRPHLFGLLALPGARYPANAVHVAWAASDVIVAFSKECLGSALVWFLHERKMIVHMTDDAKELCGMTSVSSSAVTATSCLYGLDAEAHGLWLIALTSIVNVVRQSCFYSSTDLLNDFEQAGGFHVLRYAMAHSRQANLKKLLQLASMLCYCKICSSDNSVGDTSYTTAGTNLTYGTDVEHPFENDENLVTNPTAFDVIEDLMERSVPLLACYSDQDDDAEMVISHRDDLRAIAKLSVELCLEMIEKGYDEGEERLDRNIYGSEIIVCAMQIYSDHPSNFSIIEGKYNVLTKYLLAFPSFDKIEVKHAILRTLEYAVTGLPQADCWKPLSAASEIFISLCKFILRVSVDKERGEKDRQCVDKLRGDFQLLGETLEKLLQLDESAMGLIMLEAGVMGEVLHEIMSLLIMVPPRGEDQREKLNLDGIDDVYCGMCRIIDLIINSTAGMTEVASPRLDSPNKTIGDPGNNRSIELDALLVTGMTELSPRACSVAILVFESKMRFAESEALMGDLGVVVGVLNKLVDSITSAKKQESGMKNDHVIVGCEILGMLKRVLGAIDSAQDAFRIRGGFEVLLRLLFCLEDSENNSITSNDEAGGIENSDAILAMVEAVYATFDAATKITSSSSLLASSKAVDLLGEELTGMSKNRAYITANGFYESLVKALRGLGLFDSPQHALAIMNLSLGLLHPKLRITLENNDSDTNPVVGIHTLRNSDAAKLVLGMAISLPKDQQFRRISECALNILIQLCSPDNAGTTLEEIANCGLCRTLVSGDGFSFIFDDLDHPLYSRFVALLRRVASFKMSYMDFVALLRFIANPLLTANHASHKERSEVRLPLISSSLGSVDDRRSIRSSGKLAEDLEKSINIRLKTLSVISRRADRVARCNLGGIDLNKIYSVRDKGNDAGLDDRLYTMAEEGFTKFIEIDKLQARTKRLATSDGPNSTGANLWSPANTTGFSYSLWMRLPDSEDTLTGNICVFDISSNMTGASEKKAASGRQQFISIWYDLLSQGFNIIFTGSTKPICFPASPLSPGVWHHILLTYQPPKRSVLSRKAVIGLCVDGKPLEVDIKIDAVALPPTSIMYVGVPNPILAFSGIIRGSLPTWELGSMLLVSRILGPRDAVSIFSAGPDFHGQFWGDRPQRLSLSATATSVLSMLAESNEKGGVAHALKRRAIPEIEAASHVMDKVSHNGHGGGADSVMLSSAGLFCNLPPEYIICAFHPSSSTSTMRENSVAADKGHFSRRLVNVAEIHSTNDLISSDAVVYGKGSVVCPISFGDNVQWLGGPNVLLPILNAAKTSTTIALTLRVIRECARKHIPNLEMLHAGGGYRMLALLLIQKNIMDAVILEHCFSLAVNDFEPETAEESRGEDGRKNRVEIYSWPSSENWALVDLDALKYLLKNHQVWNLQSSGPDMALRTMSLLNGLVSATSKHCDFNARRLHLLGMVKWTIHLMIEIAELYTYGKLGAEISRDVGSEHKATNELLHTVLSAYRSGWLAQTLTISSVTVGGDPGVPVLLACKMFLRRILAHMLTPDDLGEIAGAVIYTLKKDVTHEDVAGQLGYEMSAKVNDEEDPELSMGSVTRIYLLRLLEELVVDGVNEISATVSDNAPRDSDQSSANIQDLSSKEVKGKNAQLFLSAFSVVLTPTWFTCILEGCRDESSASASFRLLIIMLQNSPSFKQAFEDAGGFAPLVLSIPKYSTSTSIILAMLSQLLHAPLLHLPCFGALDPEQLCAIFDTESDDQDLILQENSKGGLETNAASTCGIFSLLAESLVRNIQLGSADNELGLKARQTNEAVLGLLTHRHTFSSAFQTFCRTPDFLEPMAQALCLVHNDRILSKNASTLSISNSKSVDDSIFYDWPSEGDGALSRGESKDSESCKERRGNLQSMDISSHLNSPTKRFVGDAEGNGGIGLVCLLRHVVNHAVLSGPKAVELIAALFRAFPIFASPDEVEAFHMVLIEQCHFIVQDTLQRGELIAIANCIGISSVLLDRLLMGFFTSEPILEAFYTIISTLNAVSDPDSYASRTLLKEDSDNIIRLNAAHCARLTCLVALQRSKPVGPWDLGDEFLQHKIITGINNNLHNLLYATPAATALAKKKNENSSPPVPGSRLHNFWQSASLKRCETSSESCKFPEISDVAEPDRAFVVALTSELHSLLAGKNQSLREEAAFLIKSMLKKRHGIMSDLLVKDIPVPVAGGVVKHVDLLNGGGFGALLLHAIGRDTSDESIEQLRLQTFFDWIEVNANDVNDIFEEIGNEALDCFPSIFSIKVPSPEDAIDQEQKEMLVRITSKEKSDKTMIGRQERVVLAQISNERTDNNQAVWKRQGLDDLSSGAMMWKSLLRQLKGSRSVWEGGSRPVKRLVFSKEELMTPFKNPDENSQKAITSSSLMRWKLDMTEGYEHQRRKLLPNYEFYGLYNVDETFDLSEQEMDDKRKSLDSTRTDLSFRSEQLAKPVGLYVAPESVVATADLLKKMQLGKTKLEDIEDLDEEGDGDDVVTGELEETDDEEVNEDIPAQDSLGPGESKDMEEGVQMEEVGNVEDVQSASEEFEEYSDDEEELFQQHHHYDLITGLLQAGDIPEKSYNVERCTGLDVYKALLLRCRDALYIIDGFEQSDEDGLKGKINRIEKTTSTFRVSIRPKNSHAQESHGANGDETDTKTESGKYEPDKNKIQVKTNSSENSRYQHRCKRLSYEELYGVFKRRYQLQPIALEFYDTYSNGSLIAFSSNTEREEVLNFLLHSSLPNSIFNSGPGPAPKYDKFIKSLRAKITNQWVQGKMTNFDFLMHLNSFAGRSYNDLTQYPIFPWVIADYDSEEIDLNNPSIYRDLSKPMGALGLARAEQFKERYEALDNNFARGNEPPPFHYGTHYSCAAYVLNYLLRMEPFSRLALSLQGGKFDLADRLFTNIGSSWTSASRDSLQDVRELIPEFFYQPEFLENKNSFDFGVKQDGTAVDNVILPPWAKGDPRRFVRINRQVSIHCSINIYVQCAMDNTDCTPPPPPIRHSRASMSAEIFTSGLI